MNKKTTTSLPESNYTQKDSFQEKKVFPSKKTLELIKLFAHNYQVDRRLPEGLQEIIVG